MHRTASDPLLCSAPVLPPLPPRLPAAVASRCEFVLFIISNEIDKLRASANFALCTEAGNRVLRFFRVMLHYSLRTCVLQRSLCVGLFVFAPTITIKVGVVQPLSFSVSFTGAYTIAVYVWGQAKRAKVGETHRFHALCGGTERASRQRREAIERWARSFSERKKYHLRSIKESAAEENEVKLLSDKFIQSDSEGCKRENGRRTHKALINFACARTDDIFQRNNCVYSSAVAGLPAFTSAPSMNLPFPWLA